MSFKLIRWFFITQKFLHFWVSKKGNNEHQQSCYFEQGCRGKCKTCLRLMRDLKPGADKVQQVFDNNVTKSLHISKIRADLSWETFLARDNVRAGIHRGKTIRFLNTL